MLSILETSENPEFDLSNIPYYCRKLIYSACLDGMELQKIKWNVNEFALYINCYILEKDNKI